jgi:hypothetical protein
MTNLPESPISANTRIKSPNGFEWQITLRDGATEEAFSNLMSLISKKEAVLLAKKWTPVEPRAFGAKQPKPVDYVEGAVCPKDKGRVIKKKSKEGKDFYTCENAKYDYTTKQKSGCDFFSWEVPTQPKAEEEFNDY